jgi:SAM-dependent methyltransferase
MSADEHDTGVQAVERFDPAAGQGRLLEAEHLARYTWAGALAAGRRVLDAGCGTGYGSELLVRAGAAEVVGIDIDAETVAVAQQAAPGARFEIADIREAPAVLGDFDLIVCFEVLEHLEDPETALDRLAQLLRPDGVLAVSSPNRDVYPPGNPYHRHEFTPQELEQALAERFEHVRIVRQLDWLATGLFEDAEFARAEGRPVQVAKAVPGEPGAELYSIGLAGNAPLPSTPPFVLLTETADAKWWQERLTALAGELDATTGELDAVRNHVRELEDWVEHMDSELDAARTAQAEVERAHAEVERALTEMQATRLWRLGTRYWELRDRILGRSRGQS